MDLHIVSEIPGTIIKTLVICGLLMAPIDADAGLSLKRIDTKEVGFVQSSKTNRPPLLVLPNNYLLCEDLNVYEMKMDQWPCIRYGLWNSPKQQKGTVELFLLPKPNGNVCRVGYDRNSQKFVIDIWKVSEAEKTIKLIGKRQGYKVRYVEATMLPDGRIVTALNSQRRLKLHTWGILNKGGEAEVEALGFAQGGTMSIKEGLRVVALPKRDGKPDGVVTAVVTGGDLKVIFWEVRPDGKLLRRGNVRGGTLDHLTMTAIEKGEKRFVVTAVRTGGDLSLSVWGISDSGQVERISTARGGSMEHVPIEVTARPNGDVLTIVKRSDWRFWETGGPLAMIAWKISSEGSITRGGSCVVPQATVKMIGKSEPAKGTEFYPGEAVFISDERMIWSSAIIDNENKRRNWISLWDVKN